MCCQHEYKDKQKKKRQGFLENWLVKFIQQEMWISHAKLLIKHFGSMYGDLCFVPNVIQVIIYIVMLGYIPNIDLELQKTFLQEFFQFRIKIDDARTLIEAYGYHNSIQIKNHMK